MKLLFEIRETNEEVEKRKHIHKQTKLRKKKRNLLRDWPKEKVKKSITGAPTSRPFPEHAIQSAKP